MSEYRAIAVTRADQVARVTILPRGTAGPGADIHWELACAFTALREDNGIRVIVLTGSGDTFHVPPPRDYYGGEASRGRLVDPAGSWRTFSGVIRCHQTMAEIEKPIVARVNGDAIGFGQSLAFASDLIVAREDAWFMDHHMGPAALSAPGHHFTGHDFSSVPGDGGAALMPLYMSPPRAKEYLMLARPYRADELATRGLINYAEPADRLDGRVDELVSGLLQRGAYALAWAKRVANRHVVEQLNRALDAGVAYEMVAFLQLDKLGGRQPTSLT